MTLSVWCEQCHRRFDVADTDTQTTTCPVCRGVDDVGGTGGLDPARPLTEEEKNAVITVEVDISYYDFYEIKADQGYDPAEWREMLELARKKEVEDDSRFFDVGDIALSWNADIDLHVNVK